MGKSDSNLINKIFDSSPLFLKNSFTSIYGYKQQISKFGENFREYSHKLKLAEKMTIDEIQEVQLEELKKLLIFAQENSAFYRRRFADVGFDATSFKSFEDFENIPVLTKEDVRKFASEISCAHIFKNIRTRKTSGTTGKPLVFPITDKSFQMGYAHQNQLLSWYNLDFKSRKAKCDGQPVTPVDQKNPPFWVQDYFNNDLYLSSYHLSEKNLPSYIKKLTEFEPDIIEGYPSSVYLLALANKNLGNLVQPKLIRTGSETLLEHQREIIEESFNCKVHNYYGSGENVVSGLECKEGKIHFQMLFGYTEFLNESGQKALPGEQASIVATGFSNYSFPLIRYAIEDEVILSADQSCKCGREGTIADIILGRKEDYVITPDGRYIGRLDHIFKKVNGVINAQIIQERQNEITIKIVKGEEYNETVESEILKEASNRLGKEMKINIRYVRDIEKSQNGKLRFVVSHLKQHNPQ